MPQTTKWNIQYPSGTTSPNVPLAMQAQAESVEAALQVISAPQWVGVGLVNGWSAYIGGGGYYGGLRASNTGNILHLHGMIRNTASGSLGSILAVLPVGYRPQYTIITNVVTGNSQTPRVQGMVLVSSEGQITYEGGALNPSYVNFNLQLHLPPA